VLCWTRKYSRFLLHEYIRHNHRQAGHGVHFVVEKKDNDYKVPQSWCVFSHEANKVEIWVIMSAVSRVFVHERRHGQEVGR